MSGAWTICGIWAGWVVLFAGLVVAASVSLIVARVPAAAEWVARLEERLS